MFNGTSRSRTNPFFYEKSIPGHFKPSSVLVDVKTVSNVQVPKGSGGISRY